MSPVLSWLAVLGLFAVALFAAHRIERFFDWVLDHMEWGVPKDKPIMGTDDCPCGLDRQYHDRMGRP